MFSRSRRTPRSQGERGDCREFSPRIRCWMVSVFVLSAIHSRKAFPSLSEHQCKRQLTQSASRCQAIESLLEHSSTMRMADLSGSSARRIPPRLWEFSPRWASRRELPEASRKLQTSPGVLRLREHIRFACVLAVLRMTVVPKPRCTARFSLLPTSDRCHYSFGSTIPFCDWYLPLRSL
jgi:hypothetical protein